MTSWLILSTGSLFCGLLFIVACCAWLHHRLLRLRDSQVHVTSSAEHVLCLRSFREDYNPAVSLSGVRRELYLTDVLRDVGPVLAVGKPGEVHHPLGAQRIYFKNEEWHDKVFELINSARLIVLAADITDGLYWEIGQVVNHVPPERLIVALPYGRALFGPIEGRKNRKVRAEVYERFREMTEGIFPVPLPRSTPHLSYLVFESSWQPTILLAFSRVGIAETLRPHLARQNIRLTRWRTVLRAVLYFPFMGFLQTLFLFFPVIAVFITLSVFFGGG